MSLDSYSVFKKAFLESDILPESAAVLWSSKLPKSSILCSLYKDCLIETYIDQMKLRHNPQKRKQFYMERWTENKLLKSPQKLMRGSPPPPTPQFWDKSKV